LKHLNNLHYPTAEHSGDLSEWWIAEEFDLWLEGETTEALKLQRPLPDEALRIVAKGEKEDRAPAWAN
jgi:hypothetical protein